MLPTPSTSHISPSVYDPAEDSFLLLDTLSSADEVGFLHARFAAPESRPSPAPLILEVGTGSGVVLAFLTAHARRILGRGDAVALGTDVNPFACRDAGVTVRQAAEEVAGGSAAGDAGDQEPGGTKPGTFLGVVRGDLISPLRPGQVDVLVFNPPYVPSDSLPSLDPFPEAPRLAGQGGNDAQPAAADAIYERDSRLLELSYAGGKDGMETTDRLLEALPVALSARGCAYVLLCAQNRPDEVKERVRGWGAGWMAETVGTSGKKAGWERLQIVRIWKGGTAA